MGHMNEGPRTFLTRIAFTDMLQQNEIHEKRVTKALKKFEKCMLEDIGWLRSLFMNA